MSKKITENKVHFYVARDNNGMLLLTLGKPKRTESGYNGIGEYFTFLCTSPRFKLFGLNESDYKNLKYNDEPVEVFLNLEE